LASLDTFAFTGKLRFMMREMLAAAY
jgi:hypothetical protein